MSRTQDITMSRTDERLYKKARDLTRQRETYKKEKYSHNLLCQCRRCDASIITKWRKVKVG